MIQANEEPQEMYFLIEFSNCHMDYNTTIVPHITDVNDYLELVNDDLESADHPGSVTIKRTAMTKTEYNDWFKENVNP